MNSDDEMDIDDDWKKPEYKNWVRGAKGLEYLQKGLQTGVAELALRHRDQIVQNITSSLPAPSNQCYQCSSNNLLPEHAVLKNCRYNCIQRKSVNCFGSRKRNRRVCPNGVCSKLYDEIVNSHRHKEPMWNNTDPNTWCSDPAGWSFAKCFQTTPNHGTSSNETDAAGLLSIILNDIYFQNEVACNLAAPNNYFSVAREIRNELLHCPKMELDDTKLQDYLNTFIAVLQDRMFKDVMSREAVQSLVQLKNNEITISLGEEVKLQQVRMEAVRALELLQGKEQEVVTNLETQSRQAMMKIKKAKLSILDEIGKSEIHQRLRKTEETIQHHTKTIQQLKKKKASVRQTHSEDMSTFSGQSPADEAYHQLKTMLRKELVDFYRSRHSKFNLSPILEDEEDTPLLEFYVMPDINAITLKRAFGGGSKEEIPIPNLRSIFFKDNIPSREIYLIADAGFGKTSFSKRLALTWCHAKEPNKRYTKSANSGHCADLQSEHSKDTKCLGKEEVKTMDEFDFLFLVFLRGSLNDCHIIDMVMNQLVIELELRNISREDLERILFTERCLVILDGLDEWSHPENSCKRADKTIPHRKAKQCTVLTTSRPWKLSDIKASQFDQTLEIARLSEESAKSLKERVITHLCAEKEVKKRVNEFNSSIKEKKITNLIKIPIMLMYCICLFCENRELGKSLCMLYSNIIDMLFCRTVKIHKKVPRLRKISQGKIPQCFKENEFCIKFYKLLIALGKLAFRTLFAETRDENTLVFDRSVVDQFINEDCLNFCLKTGILTESKVRLKLTKQETKVSFAHKTVQEFFAALHSTTDPVSFQEKVLTKCKCVKDILEMSKILIFVSGINEKLSSLVLSEVINIVNDDPITHEYRSNVCFSSRLKEFQDLCVSCCREFTCEFQHNLCLHDVFIDDSCREEQYHETLKQLTTGNAHGIRSLDINMVDMYMTPINTTQKVIDYFALRCLVNIEKIQYEALGLICGEDILPLLNSSLKQLALWCDHSRSYLVFEKLKGLQKLESICISGLIVSHSELNLLLDYISQRICIKEIELLKLSCTDHEGDSCSGVDLSQHLSLRKLTLEKLPLTQVVVNMSSLEKCRLYQLYNPDLVLKFLNCADCKLETFECNGLTSSAAIDTLLDTFPLLHHVRQVCLYGINLGTRKITFSSQVNIECLRLSSVTTEASTLRELADFLHKLPQPVTVELCSISPEEEFKTVKEKLKTLRRHFSILVDETSFAFKTIKDRD